MRPPPLQDQQKLFDGEREQLRSQHLANVEAKDAELLAARVENGMLTGAQSQLQLRCTGAENALAAMQTEFQEARQAQAAASAKSTDLMRASKEKEAELLKLQVKVDELQKVEAEKQELKQQLDQARAERAEAHRLKEDAASAHALAVTQNEEAIEAWRAELETCRQAAQEKVSGDDWRAYRTGLTLSREPGRASCTSSGGVRDCKYVCLSYMASGLLLVHAPTDA